MAVIKKYKKSVRGKKIHCEKCGKEISPGTEYFKAVPFRKSPLIRCISCGIKPYEASSSEYIRKVGGLVEEWEKNIGFCDTTVRRLSEELSALRDNTEAALRNIPEQYREEEAGLMLQERIEQLDDALTELDNISPLEEYLEEAYDDAVNKVGGVWPENGKEMPEFESRDEWKTALEEEQERFGNESFAEAINDALSVLEY